ncbi:MAG: RdgB/HAM1 family non-canonical purine NTP pyrophosphatase [Myxococcales bacterium]|jgi:XTP/dITP diphosphohydrolase
MKILLATMNAGKLREYKRLLADVVGLDLETMARFPEPVEVVEDQETFLGNARKKATEVAAVAGIPCLADDSGLEVDALGGRPGVRSARYAGEGATDAGNNAKLLDTLRDVPEADRRARFRCVIAVVDADGRELAMVEGTCEGRIAGAPRGGHGFGYDPVFIPDGFTQTMAELGPETKDRISHRAQAAAKLVPLLRQLQGP